MGGLFFLVRVAISGVRSVYRSALRCYRPRGRSKRFIVVDMFGSGPVQWSNCHCCFSLTAHVLLPDVTGCLAVLPPKDRQRCVYSVLLMYVRRSLAKSYLVLEMLFAYSC